MARVEKGRIALLLSDQIWLWARGYEGGGPHLDLLRRLAHWLMKEPQLEEEALRARAKGQDLTLERQSLKGDVPTVTLTAPDGSSRQVTLQTVAPGLSNARLHVEDNGLYRATDGEHIALVNVGPENPLEYQEVVSTTQHLAPLAEATGGASRRIGDASALRIVEMRDSPVYAGSGFLAIKRVGRERADRGFPLAVRAGVCRAGAAAWGAGGDVVAGRRTQVAAALERRGL